VGEVGVAEADFPRVWKPDLSWLERAALRAPLLGDDLILGRRCRDDFFDGFFRSRFEFHDCPYSSSWPPSDVCDAMLLI